MTPPNPHEEALFLVAAGLPPAERGALLDRECGGNPALRHRLEALLAAHDELDSVLTPFDEPQSPSRSAPPSNCSPDAVVGQSIDRYKVLERLGEGGCGVVYVAEQTEPVRRRVALKVIKQGMDTRAVVARFEAERQALAMMDHPNIARVLDAGTTEAGRPYFVMELVRGVRITEYCDHVRLPARERLDLFIKVCHAIQHAHQKGIIHRDIKPSNILVTLHDGIPVPKVIDFGIAKATEGSLTEATVYTHLHQFLGTPAYTSPEQAGMGATDVDTRSDIYSLGVLLYELLTGKTPFDARELLASGFDTMRRTIRETEPAPPSTRLATLAREDLTTTAQRRSLDAPTLIHLIRGDLDWIVMKCLEKDRARRYETANGLAADLRRHLRDEPVVARPPSAGYKLRKALRRNKLIFASGAAVTLALIAGLGVSLWQGAVARQARKDAEAAREVAVQRSITESEAKADEARQREAAEREYARATDLLCQLEIQKAGELLLSDRPSSAVAYLGRILREHPTNPSVSLKLFSALTHLSFAWPVMDLPGHRVIGFSRDSPRFLTIANTAIHLWDPVTGGAVARPLAIQGAQFAEFSPDGSRVVVSVGWMIYIHDGANVLNSPAVSPLTIQWTNGPVSIAFSSDGAWLVTASSSSAQVWDARSGQPLFPPVSSIAREGPFTSARFSPNNRSLLTTTRSGIQIWDRTTGRLESSFSDTGRNPFFGGAKFSPDSDRWMTSSSQRIHTWDTASGQRLAVISPGSTLVQSEFSPDGQRLLTATTDRVVRVWNSGIGQPLGESLKHDERVTVARFSPNGQWVLTITGNGVGRIWDLVSGRQLIDGFHVSDTVGNNYSLIRSAQFSPDGRFVAVEYDGSVRVWEILMTPVLPDPAVRHSTAPKTTDPSDPSGDVGGTHGPPPEWFPEFVEAVAGQELTGTRTLQRLPFAARLRSRKQLFERDGDDPYTRLAKWLLADRSDRTVSPFSSTTLDEHIRGLVKRDTAKSLQEALRLSPADGLALSKLAVHVAAQDPQRNPRRAAEADHLSRRGLRLRPGDPEALLLRAEVLAAIDKAPEALLLNEEALRSHPQDPALWNQRGSLLERTDSPDQAETAYSRAIALARASPDIAPDRRARYMLSRSDLRARQNRPAEAEVDRLEAHGLLQTLPRDDSPQWGGNDPGRNLYAPASGLPDSFHLEAMPPFPKELDLRTTRGIRFVVPLGSQSYEAPVVAHGKIFVGTNNDNLRDPRHEGDRSILMCLDEASGKFLWQLVIPKLASGKVNDWESLGLLSTPTVEGNRVYLVTTRCEVLCLTTDGLARGNVGPFRDEAAYSAGPGNPEIEPGPKDADIVWRYDMIEQLGSYPHNGSRTHVLIVGDLLYVGTCNGMDWTHVNIPAPHAPSLIAVNKHTGELVAEDNAGISSRIFHGQWSSPSTGRVGTRQLVFFGGGDGFCYAFDAIPSPGSDFPVLKGVWWADLNPPEYTFKNGRPIRYPAADGPSEVLATPVFWRDRVYVAIGQDPEHGEGLGNLVCLDATKEGDITQTGVLWSYRGIQRSMSTAAITPEGLLFIVDFSGFVHCVDAETGQPYWTHDMRAHVWGSTLVADGKVYVGDEDGDFVVFAADRTKKVLSATLRDGLEVDGPNVGSAIYSTPVVANGVVYINSGTHLFALEDPSKKAGSPSPAPNPGPP